MSSLDENDQFGQLTSDFIDNKNNIYKTKGTFIHLIKNINININNNNNNGYQVNDILNNQLFEIPSTYFKKVEYSDLPNDVQQLISPSSSSSLHKKKTRSVTTLFSKFRTSKSSKSSNTTTNTTTPSSSNTNNNYFNNNIKSNNTNTNTGSNTSLLDNTSSSNNSSNTSTIKLTTFDDSNSYNGGGGGDTSQYEDDEDIDSDEDDIILHDRTNSFIKATTTSSSSSNRLNSLTALPSMDLPSLDLPPPSFNTSTTIISPKLSINSSNNITINNNITNNNISNNNINININNEIKELISLKLLKYYYKKQFKEYISKSPQVRQARLRKAALLEILTTEQTYFNSLLTCKQLFMDPLLNEAQTKKKPTLSLSDINDIFGELPNIMQASQLLMNDLKKEIDKWPTNPILIGNIFKSFAPFFRMYSKYINNFDSVAEKVEKLEKTSKSFSQFLTKTHEMSECCGLTFLSYLVCPVQRVPRIRMLLQEVIRRTDETHIDYQLLEQALLIVNQVAENLNESKRIAENDKIVFDLQEKMKGRFNNLLQAHRKFTTCFNSIHVESSREIEKKRLFGFYNIYLFNDMLLIVPSINNNSSINNSNNSSNNSSSSNIFGNNNNSSSSSLNDSSSSQLDSSNSSIEEEERNRIARESFAIYLAFSQIKDKNDSNVESSSPSNQLLKLSSITSNSIGKYTFIMNTFIKTQQVKLTFSFNSQLQRDEMEAETTLNIEQLELKNEKLFGKSKLKIENKRIEHVKLIKSNDMILSKNLLQKHVNSEKLKEISDRLITCELELEVKLQYYKNYKDEYSKQSEKLEQIYQKESESLIEYEEQVQKIIQIDDTICKMLNHDIDAFRELFMDDPRNLLDQQLDHHLDFNSPSLLNSVTTVGSIGNNLSNTAQLYDITGNIGPLTSQSINNSNNNNSSNSSGSSSNSSQQNTRNTISLSNENVEPEYSRKQTILPTRRMFNSAAALNLGILDGSSNRDSSLPLKQLKDTCNPYIQQAYKELRRKTFTSATTTSTNTSNNNNTTNAAILESNDNDEEVEVFNTLYRIRPNRKWYMMEPIKKLPNKYSIDRLLHGENTPQDIIPKIYPYPDEYNDPDLYYDKISHRDGFYNEEEEEMFQNQYNDDDDEFKSFNRNYSNYFDLPSNVDELRTMIIKLQFEKEDMRNEISKLKQQLSSNNSNSTPSTPFSTTPTNNSIMNDSFNSLQPLTTSTSSNNNNITSPNTLSMPQSSSKQPIEYVASDFIDDYIE